MGDRRIHSCPPGCATCISGGPAAGRAGASDFGFTMMRARSSFLIVAIAGAVVSAIGGLFASGQFFRSYLFAWIFWLGLALGCFALTMLHHLVGGKWGFATRRFHEAGLGTLPLLALLAVPLFFGLS